MKHLFNQIAQKTAYWTGSPQAFILAIFVVLAWATTGPLFRYSDTWQLVINTGTTIVTFLMVFLVQATQNRDTLALHAKLDGLIEKSEAENATLIGLEKKDVEEIEAVRDALEKKP
jgi:low affinity Fe/Cu permease